jgi:hypothetical protein
MAGYTKVEGKANLLVFMLNLLCQSLKHEALPKRKLSLLVYKLVLVGRCTHPDHRRLFLKVAAWLTDLIQFSLQTTLGGLKEVEDAKNKARLAAELPLCEPQSADPGRRLRAKVPTRQLHFILRQDSSLSSLAPPSFSFSNSANDDPGPTSPSFSSLPPIAQAYPDDLEKFKRRTEDTFYGYRDPESGAYGAPPSTMDAIRVLSEVRCNVEQCGFIHCNGAPFTLAKFYSLPVSISTPRWRAPSARRRSAVL